ncbi:MFS transporter [Nonomuraea harbinensis]|uniref:MFS transporter n=1 Tax=Nonomuraea harbinensis TaxID=1286938 RepID=A0ABW1C540_9ACTN|nr:MFS transporter [Nonomuraea harbinensis]
MTMTAERAPGVLSSRYRGLSVGLVALIMLVAFEAMAVTTAMPVVARELGGLHLYNLAFSATLAASVIATVLGGRWSDRSGPMPPIAAGVAAFVAGLLLAGAAPTMEVLVAGRFVQGLGAGLIQVALYVFVARVYPPELHPKVFALFSAAWVVPSMVGPTIAGLVAEHAGWRWIFYGVSLIVVPAALLLWRGGGDRATGGAGAADAPAIGGKLAWAALTAVAAALIQYGSALGLGGVPLLAAGGALLAVALPRLLPAGSLRAARGLPSGPVLRGLAYGSLMAAQVLIPLMLTQERGLSLAAAGVVLTVGALGWSAGSWIKGRGTIGNMTALRGGALMIAAGISLVSLVLIDAVPIGLAHVAMAISGLGIGMLHPTVSVLVLEMSAKGEEGGNAAALGVGESVFTVVAVAVSGALFTATGQGYLVGLAFTVVLALGAAWVAPRFVHPAGAGTLEEAAS